MPMTRWHSHRPDLRHSGLLVCGCHTYITMLEMCKTACTITAACRRGYSYKRHEHPQPGRNLGTWVLVHTAEQDPAFKHKSMNLESEQSCGVLFQNGYILPSMLFESACMTSEPTDVQALTTCGTSPNGAQLNIHKREALLCQAARASQQPRQRSSRKLQAESFTTTVPVILVHVKKTTSDSYGAAANNEPDVCRRRCQKVALACRKHGKSRVCRKHVRCRIQHI